MEIKELRELLGITQSELADRIGVTKAYISLIENGKQAPSKNISKKLDELKKLTNVNKKSNSLVIPILDISAAAGKGENNEQDLVIGTTEIGEEFNKYWGDQICAMKISGDSMEPTIEKNAWVLVRRTHMLKPEGIFIFMHDNLLRCKRIQKKGTGEIIVKSDNPHYDTEIYPVGVTQLGEMILLGEVVGILNKV